MTYYNKVSGLARASGSQRKGSDAPSARSPEVDEQRMRSGH